MLYKYESIITSSEIKYLKKEKQRTIKNKYNYQRKFENGLSYRREKGKKFKIVWLLKIKMNSERKREQVFEA